MNILIDSYKNLDDPSFDKLYGRLHDNKIRYRKLPKLEKTIRTKYLSKVNEYGYFCLSDGKLVTKKIMNRTYYLHEKGYWVCTEKGLDDLIIYHQN